MAQRCVVIFAISLFISGQAIAGCSKLPQLSDLISVANFALDGHAPPDPEVLAQLNDLTMSLSRAQLQSNLSVAGHKDSYPRLSLFVTDVALFAASGLKNGPAAAQSYALRPSFQSRLEMVRALLREVCSRDRYTEDLAQTFSRLGELSMATLRGLLFDANGVFRLGGVFALLLTAVVTLAVGRLSFIWFSAYLRFRHACQLPARLIAGDRVIDGTVIVIGRNGCNFRPNAKPDAATRAALGRGAPCLLHVEGWVREARTNRGLTSTVGLLFDTKPAPSTLRKVLRSSLIPARRTASRGEDSQSLMTQIFQH